MEVIVQIQNILILVSLIVGVLVSLRSFYGFFGGSSYTSVDKFASNIFIILLYVQVVLIAYIFTNSSFNYEESLKAIEHAALTLFATILTQGGRLIALRSGDDSVKFRFRSIYYGMATGLLIYAYIITLEVTFS